MFLIVLEIVHRWNIVCMAVLKMGLYVDSDCTLLYETYLSTFLLYATFEI